MAREFGVICWRTALASISGEQVVEWREHFSKHGFTHHMENLRFAVACASNWNVTAMSAGIKLDPPMSYQDFLPTQGEPEQTREYSDEELMAKGASAGGTRFECQ
ncbi:TPA: phage tail protein [Vibrio parahaemolyticus]|nr:phage tail protein [Vibrio parahaemolyticus]HBC3541903.1 phage tail protein [Vibrio parahaemolyticus]HBC3546917.1 phage tail protein [Vibrio parahaemolyticus]HBC3570589.1 phage tail protein [Vibrio parahaemolyticus]HCE5244044.1 phage tail protein [Vibrio parahaemolyticus]